jgi:hypothetical protein
MFRISFIRSLLLGLMVSGLAACGGTSTDNENLLNSPSSLSTDGSSTTQDTTNTGDTGTTEPAPTPEPEPVPVPAPGNQAPNAVISATPTSGVATLLVNVDATQSSDDQGITSYSWTFGDGNVSQSPVTSHS